MKTDNEQILATRETEFNKIQGARVGDFLLMPNGEYTRFTHKWDDHIQTGGGGRSFYLGHGYIDYSGGLDPGVKLADIEQTNETKAGFIWFFSNDIWKAHNGVNFKINFRVFKLKPDADLSGLYNYQKWLIEQEVNKSETYTRINGNGKPYTKHLPEICILTKNVYNDVYMKHLEDCTKLKFKRTSYGYSTQPMKHEQITVLLIHSDWKVKHTDNWMGHCIYFETI